MLTCKLQPLCQKQYLTINEVQVRSGNSLDYCLSCPQVVFENESRKKCSFVITTSLRVSSVKLTALQRVSRSN
jgi:hypothetical protein